MECSAEMEALTPGMENGAVGTTMQDASTRKTRRRGSGGEREHAAAAAAGRCPLAIALVIIFMADG